MISSQTVVPKVYVNNTTVKANPKRDWWNRPDAEAWSDCIAVLESIKDRQKYRRDNDAVAAKLYSLEEWRNHNIALYGHSAEINRPAGRIRMNIVKPNCDTAAAKIAKNKPRIVFLTERAPHKKQKAAKKLTQYIDGLFSEQKVKEKSVKAFLYGAVYGSGFIKSYSLHDKPAFETVLPTELWVDELDGLYGSPQVKYQTKFMHRDTVADYYATTDELKALVANAQPAKDLPAGNPYASDMLCVVEAWKLPTTKEAADGKHIICINGATLSFKPWKRSYFPFAKFDWSPRLLGYFGAGIPEEISGIQFEINKTLRDISDGHDTVAKPRILEHKQARTSTINDKIGSKWLWEGSQKPEFFTATAFNPETYNHLWRLHDKSFEITGISQMSSSGKKPPGLDAAVALREYSDVETERFVLVGERFEQMFIDLARMAVDESDELYETNKELSVKAKGGKFISTIKWSEIDLKEDSFIMDLYPASALPRTPAGRMQKLQEMFKDGIIGKDEFLATADLPDLEDFTSIQTAAVDDAKYMVEQMLDEGEAQYPNPIGNLQMQLQIATGAALRAKQDKYPEDRIELVLSFIKSCVIEIQKAQAPAPMAAAPMGMLAPGAPAPMADPAAPPPV